MDILAHRWRGPRALVGLVATLLLTAGLVVPVSAQPTSPVAVANHTAEISLMAVSDVHGTALNWDYMTDRTYTGSNIRGLARVSTSVEQVRAERGDEATLLFDIGDTIQGTMLAAYYALRYPITEGSTHPVAVAMNTIGFDAMTVGNHEFNFGLQHLYAFEPQLDFPLLAANALDPTPATPRSNLTRSSPSTWTDTSPSGSACSA